MADHLANVEWLAREQSRDLALTRGGCYGGEKAFGLEGLEKYTV
jgi:hypothetical protein